MQDGAGELYDGTVTLKDGAGTLYDGTKTIKNGMEGLFAGSGTLYDGIVSYVAGVGAVNDNMGAVAQGAAAAKTGGAGVATRLWGEYDRLERIIERARGEQAAIMEKIRAGSETDDWITVNEAARLLHSSVAFVYQRIDSGALRSKYLGRKCVSRAQIKEMYGLA